MSPGTCSDSDGKMEGGHNGIRQKEMRVEGVGREGEGKGEEGGEGRRGEGVGREGEGRGEVGRRGEERRGSGEGRRREGRGEGREWEGIKERGELG